MAVFRNYWGRMARGASLGLLTLALSACLSDDQRASWRDAALYMYGPYQYAQNIERIRTENAAQGIGINAVAHVRNLSDHTSRRVTTPNADTLYSSAVLDLSTGPVEFIVPAAPDRYVSVMVMDIFSDLVDLVGSWEADQAQRVWIVGPDWSGDLPEDVSLIRSPGLDAWLLGRTFVAGPEDLDAARDVQSQLIVRSVDASDAPAPAWSIPSDDDAPRAQQAIDVVNLLLGRAPNHPHTMRAAAFLDKGIEPGAEKRWDSLSQTDQVVWWQTLKKVERGLKTGLMDRANRNGWQTPPDTLARFGEDDAARAAVSLVGFGAMRPQDAIYFTSVTDAEGSPLDGGQTYTLRFEPDRVPVDGFWSITAYAVEADGRRFLFDNPLGRYSINSQTPRLIQNEAGQLTLHLSADTPDTPANWLPLPEGPSAVIFRAYRPQTSLLTGAWTPPDIQPVLAND